MTLEQIRRSAKAVLIPTDVAEVLGCDPQSIRDQARYRPDLLGFPVTVVRRRTYIPGWPFFGTSMGRTWVRRRANERQTESPPGAGGQMGGVLGHVGRSRLYRPCVAVWRVLRLCHCAGCVVMEE